MGSADPPDRFTSGQKFAAVALVGALLGGVLSPVAFGATSEPSGTVAVIEIEGPIESSLADDVESELHDIRQNESVQAVVLKMNTPGGAAPASERMYLAVQRTAEQMPVIASVQGYSASGGYYTMLPADEIYVLPTSVTGSVGLATNAPEETEPVRGPSGPDKRGENIMQQWAVQQTLADTFINTVMEQRGDRIELDRNEIATASVWLGTEAVQNGLADRVGSTDKAVRAAAQQAGLDDYQIDTRETGPDRSIFLLQTDAGIVAVHTTDPGYGQVKPLGNAYVYQGAIPHVDEVERFTDADVASVNGPTASDSTDEQKDEQDKTTDAIDSPATGVVSG